MASSLIRSSNALCTYLAVSNANKGPLGTLQSTRGRTRGPPRFFGWTKSQYLDFLVRMNVRTSLLITFTIVPVVILWFRRYVTVIRPQNKKIEEEKLKELLSEGEAKPSSTQ